MATTRWERAASRIKTRCNQFGNDIVVLDYVPEFTFKGIIEEKASEVKHYLPVVIEDQPVRTVITILAPYEAQAIIKPGYELYVLERKLTVLRCIPIAFGNTVIGVTLVCDI